MPVLGKRSRAVHGSDAKTSPCTRSSFVIVSDHEEEEDPFITPRKSKRTKRSTRPVYDDIDELAIENSPPTKFEKVDRPQSAPTTPRHRDTIKKIAITPRHRLGLLARPQTPQSLQSPSTPKSRYPSVYNDARKLFKSSIQSNKIIGRENERAEIVSLVEKRIISRSSGCLYVSGPPGTGKSALIGEVLGELRSKHDFQSCYSNCMAIKSAADVYSTILNDFGIIDAKVGNEMEHLRKLFHSRQTSHLVILDEIDYLLEVDIDLLYQLFEWSSQKNSSLVIIGIANALDLTERFLPRLKSKNLKPHLVPFMPYTATEITNVITTKFKSLLTTSNDENFVPFIHPTAIMFLSKKVAAQTGDIRKAFAICLRAIDLIESDTLATVTPTSSTSGADLTPSASPSSSPSKTPLGENVFLSSPNPKLTPRKMQNMVIKTPANPMSNFTCANAPRATIAHVARVTASVFSNGAQQRLNTLNLQQKAALCALAALESYVKDVSNAPDTPSKTGRSEKKALAPTIRSLYETYVGLVKRETALAPLTATEFGDVLTSLETLSLVSGIGGKSIGTAAPGVGTPSRRGRTKNDTGLGGEEVRVASCIGVSELKSALKGVGSGILVGILEGDVV